VRSDVEETVMSTSVWWVRRDIRRSDNKALQSAAAAGKVVPLFVWDDVLFNNAGAARREFMCRALNALDDSIDRALIYRDGPVAEAVVEFCRLVGADTVHITEDFAPHGRKRDGEVEKALEADGRRLVRADTPYVIAPGTVRKDDGTPVKVFTPFYKRWMTHQWSSAPENKVEFADFRDLCVGSRMDANAAVLSLHPSEESAWERFDEWSPRAMGDYKEARNNPGIDGTSMMSPYLKFGIIHPRQLLQRLDGTAGSDVFRSEIAWREFYADVLFHQPETTWKNLQPKMDALPVDSGPIAEERFTQFCEARTGYPIVDAGIRQLLATGWMHNRVRMIVASFLVKDLHLPWQWGAKFFMEHLIDGDVASNAHGWQWTAGTGTDASPFFRVFNPMGQSEKFDPDGQYLRRWIPEIAHLDNASIHAPWTLGLLAPEDYPAPMVDHAVEREEALSRYKAVSGK
jgi:deoxyribodipyrimidine photo-lyase